MAEGSGTRQPGSQEAEEDQGACGSAPLVKGTPASMGLPKKRVRRSHGTAGPEGPTVTFRHPFKLERARKRAACGDLPAGDRRGRGSPTSPSWPIGAPQRCCTHPAHRRLPAPSAGLQRSIPRSWRRRWKLTSNVIVGRTQGDIGHGLSRRTTRRRPSPVRERGGCTDAV